MENLEKILELGASDNISHFKCDISRLSLAWNLIIDSRFNEWLEFSESKRAGIIVYKMLPEKPFYSRSESEEPFFPNCEVYYFSSSLHKYNYDLILEKALNRDALLKIYDPSLHVLVTVHVPTVINSEDTIGSVRLFSKILSDDGHIVEINM